MHEFSTSLAKVVPSIVDTHDRITVDSRSSLRTRVVYEGRYGRWRNCCTIRLKITPKLCGKTRRRRRAKLAAALRAAANFGRRGRSGVSRFSAQFGRNVQPNRSRICPSTVLRWLLYVLTKIIVPAQKELRLPIRATRFSARVMPKTFSVCGSAMHLL